MGLQALVGWIWIHSRTYGYIGWYVRDLTKALPGICTRRRQRKEVQTWYVTRSPNGKSPTSLRSLPENLRSLPIIRCKRRTPNQPSFFLFFPLGRNTHRILYSHKYKTSLPLNAQYLPSLCDPPVPPWWRQCGWNRRYSYRSLPSTALPS